jgi:hypothetical protein
VPHFLACIVAPLFLTACQSPTGSESETQTRAGYLGGQPVCHKGLEPKGICFTTLAALLTNPGAYDGKRVSFIGRLYVDGGAPTVYLSDIHHETYDHMASLELLGAQAPILLAYERFGWSYVKINGVFKAFDGPEATGMRAGSLSELEIGGGMSPREIDTTQQPWLRLDQPE